MSEDKLKVNCPEILWPAIRQYAKTCDNELVPAFHYRKAMAIVIDMQARIEELESTPTGKAPCIKFCEATAFRYEMKRKDARIEDLQDLARAAKKFIESHAADPDLTNEMIENYEVYCDLQSQVIIFDD